MSRLHPLFVCPRCRTEHGELTDHPPGERLCESCLSGIPRVPDDPDNPDWKLPGSIRDTMQGFTPTTKLSREAVERRLVAIAAERAALEMLLAQYEQAKEPHAEKAVEATEGKAEESPGGVGADRGADPALAAGDHLGEGADDRVDRGRGAQLHPDEEK